MDRRMIIMDPQSECIITKVEPEAKEEVLLLDLYR